MLVLNSVYKFNDINRGWYNYVLPVAHLQAFIGIQTVFHDTIASKCVDDLKGNSNRR